MTVGLKSIYALSIETQVLEKTHIIWLAVMDWLRNH